MDFIPSSPPLSIRPPTAREVVLRLAVERLQKNYKNGWLFYRCREQGLLNELKALEAHGSLEVLELGCPHRAMPPTLFIELVPRSCWFDNVRSHVRVEHWGVLKRRTFRDARWRCEICRGVGPTWPVECHEVWNYDDEARVQKLERLIALCPDCHRVKHMGLANRKRQRVEATAHLALVNGWSYAKAQEHVDQAFDVWERRSREQWTLDISLINEFLPEQPTPATPPVPQQQGQALALEIASKREHSLQVDQPTMVAVSAWCSWPSRLWWRLRSLGHSA